MTCEIVVGVTAVVMVDVQFAVQDTSFLAKPGVAVLVPWAVLTKETAKDWGDMVVLLNTGFGGLGKSHMAVQGSTEIEVRWRNA